ncbi:hypothetical protein [Candidatus Enterococcus mansonii]|uniref:Shikimate kinase n=1 Tax=Candidatus Enterococcus mansonii TaxID=1834181 RepID=A0A242C5P3_9ENTE|nr:hypothetical protein [Enterococcus sp. 4G2_DIV0659]OTO05511.1 hypothetical protein A5880_002684 [Enterococcus sp. 4G2_DIV0659]
MNVFFIFGPQAVGKMTIGEIVAKKLDLIMLHNHRTLELLQPIFGWTAPTFELSALFRQLIFSKFVEEQSSKGLVFTLVLDFSSKADMEEFNQYKELFTAKGIEPYFVELEADLSERLYRNKTEHRLNQKPSKRDTSHSEKELLQAHEDYRLNSLPGEVKEKYYYRLDVTSLTAEQAADRIMKQFNLKE